MTTEQLIILGFLAAAFIAGWLARALIGRRDRAQADVERASEETSREAAREAAPEAQREAAREAAEARAVVLDERLEGAIEATREELDRAIQSHVAAVALALAVRQAGPAASNELADEVSAALQDDVANQSMLSIMDSGNGAALSERELDLTDWGFAYGVAWARTRERDPSEAGDAVAREALQVAEDVFRAYAAEAEWARERKDNGRA